MDIRRLLALSARPKILAALANDLMFSDQNQELSNEEAEDTEKLCQIVQEALADAVGSGEASRLIMEGE